MNTFTLLQEEPNQTTITVYPNANVSGCTQWTPSAGDNYACIDEEVLNTNDYVSTVTTDYKIDMYSLPSTSQSGTIDYIKVYAYAWLEFPSVSGVEFYVLCSPTSDCTNYYASTNQALTTNGLYCVKSWTNNPSTASPWAWSDIANLGIGFRGKTAYGEFPASLILRPNSAGHYDDWEYENPTGGTHYTLIDEAIPDDATTYVRSQQSAPLAWYHVQSSPTLVGKTINSVTMHIRGKNNSGYGKLLVSIYDSDADTHHGYNFGSISNTWTNYSETVTSNPTTGVAFTPEDIDFLEWGFRATNNTNMSITQYYLTVNYNYQDYPYIRVGQCYAVIGYTPSASSATLNMPLEGSIDHERNVNMLNFWDGEREVYDLSRSRKTTVFRGMEFVEKGNLTPATRITAVRDLAKNGGEITISDFDMDCFNGKYKILSFGWKIIGNNPESYEWILELEDTELL